jgi:mannose-6-phosphate isomerase
MSILQESTADPAVMSRPVCRPWGSYLVVDEGVEHQAKRLTVHPGRRLSYQRHRSRDEHWFVVSGLGEATLDGRVIPLAAGDSVDIPAGCAHRVANRGAGALVLVEVQTGSYFGEDDIERLADDYGRAPG